MESTSSGGRRSSSSSGGGGGGEKGKQQQGEAEGERILAPTRRPDGTLRKPIRIRAGYVPQDEVAIYQSKGALLKKCSIVPPGYDPLLVDAKPPRTKSVKRNERKKEKKLQAALASPDGKGKNMDFRQDEEAEAQVASSAVRTAHGLESVESITSQMNMISISSTNPSVTTDSGAPGNDLDKKIRALKKKIRLAGSQQNGIQQNMKPEQLEKLAKVKGWREELKCLEDKKAALAS